MCGRFAGMALLRPQLNVDQQAQQGAQQGAQQQGAANGATDNGAAQQPEDVEFEEVK